MDDIADLPLAEFGFPGTLRDRLVAAILAGEKTATSSLLVEYEREGEPLPVVGARAVVPDSDGRAVAEIVVTEVRVVPLARVDVAHAVAEGEGDRTVAEWRASHERFWHGDEFRATIGDPEFTVDDATDVVLERFALTLSTALPLPRS
ncbi:ASCH domain-containing protein [Leifsonia sp. NPDC058194]|uniref:ASCH domain-containing protein n=1 Tax=Leifsonia sp. NPDC058194 TaxID=3346374 RepID=UPI0036DC8049